MEFFRYMPTGEHMHLDDVEEMILTEMDSNFDLKVDMFGASYNAGRVMKEYDEIQWRGILWDEVGHLIEAGVLKEI